MDLRRKSCGFGVFENRDGGGIHIRGHDFLSTGEDVDHVGAVLAGAHDPVNFSTERIVAADGLCGLGGEPDFALGEGEAMRATQSAEIDLRFGFLADEVDHGKRMECAEAVIGNVSRVAVGGGDDFVGIIADGNARDNLQGCGVHDGEGVVLLGENEQRCFRSCGSERFRRGSLRD